jgi:hypothetical protein
MNKTWIVLLNSTYFFSGAGKTVSAKYIMRYFATADSNDSDQLKVKAEGSGMTEVEEQILGRQTPPRLFHIETKPHIDFFVKRRILSWKPLVMPKQLGTTTLPDLENTLRYFKKHRNTLPARGQILTFGIDPI